ncbi:MAG: hypothetical protein ACRESR_00600, partial [Gammaproteobacteria bacterium]
FRAQPCTPTTLAAPMPDVPATPASQPQPAQQAAAPASPQLNCPPAQATHNAIEFHHVVLCMTPQQVLAAEGPAYRGHTIKSAVYGGIQFTTWYYPEHMETWPTIVRFRNGVVTGWE